MQTVDGIVVMTGQKDDGEIRVKKKSKDTERENKSEHRAVCEA